MLDVIIKYGNIAGWIVIALVFYFSDQKASADFMAKLDTRVTVNESKIRQELLGYEQLQASIGQRLRVIEGKLDCIMNERLCAGRHGN